MKKEQNLQEPQKQALNIPVVRRSLWLKFSDWVKKGADEEECERNRAYGLCDYYTKEQRQECKNRINGVC